MGIANRNRKRILITSRYTETAVVAVKDENGLIKPKAFIVLKESAESGEGVKAGIKGFVKKC